VVEALNGFCSLSTEHQNLIRERVSSSKSEVDPDDVPIDPNELVRMNWSEELEPANELLMPLLPYQKEGLGWMVNQEKSAVRGGILADEVSVLPFF
jgi:DNA repair protein RAD16